LRSVPSGGSVPTRGVIFFATKGDNRVWALDIENQLVELVFDNDNMQLEVGFDDVDNVTVSPFGDVLVAEDGDAMRLVVIVPNGEAKVLMQITRGLSEITGPAFTPDGSRLYFSSQRGPTLPGLQVPGQGEGGGVTFEMTIPEAFRTLPEPPPAPNPDPAPDPDPSPDPAPDPDPVPNVTVTETQAGAASVGALLGGAAAIWAKRARAAMAESWDRVWPK
ncbi:MAG: alkaline phosphatase PhoX, partial [Abyssibacter sp.]|uniref:alkaline phosphatase PhoX n=1 Tax=Abyssibacter sp. TaxID=2320200 RepID=UPI00321C05F3